MTEVYRPFTAIECWARGRNIIKGATPQAQMVKLMEEVGELSAAINKSKPEQVQQEIGDCFVVLTILAAQHGLLAEECIEAAYAKIKDRKGRMVAGIFVKEDDI